MTSVAQRAGGNHALFREVNERIAQLARNGVGANFFICECSDQGCAESLEITQAEYNAVRAHSNRFVVRAGHQLSGLERVVDGTSRFLVVEHDVSGDLATAAM